MKYLSLLALGMACLSLSHEGFAQHVGGTSRQRRISRQELNRVTQRVHTMIDDQFDTLQHRMNLLVTITGLRSHIQAHFLSLQTSTIAAEINTTLNEHNGIDPNRNRDVLQPYETYIVANARIIRELSRQKPGVESILGDRIFNQVENAKRLLERGLDVEAGSALNLALSQLTSLERLLGSSQNSIDVGTLPAQSSGAAAAE